MVPMDTAELQKKKMHKIIVIAVSETLKFKK